MLSIFPQLETVGRFQTCFTTSKFNNLGKTPNPILVISTSFVTPLLIHCFQKHFQIKMSVPSYFLKWCLGFSFILQVISYFSTTAPLVVKICSWLSFPVGFVVPFFATQNLFERIICWMMALFLPYSLLSLAYESLFVLIFCILLLTYVRLEFSHLSDEQFFQLEVKLHSAPSTQASG